MIIYFFILVAVIFYKIKFANKKNGEYFEDYLSKEKTSAIKGIFVILVFLMHIRGYLKSETLFDKSFDIIAVLIGQLVVAMFLFYSGYGIYEAIKNKGRQYISSMPIKRILITLLHFDVAIIFFIILNLIIGKEYNLKTILLSFISWDSVGNSNWFIFAILYLYISTYISFKIFKNKHNALCVNTVLSLLYIIIMSFLKETWWYDTILCYNAGMWLSRYKDELEKIKSIKSNYYTTLFSIILIFGILFKFRGEIIAYELYSIIFCLIIVVLSMKISIDNKILRWFGSHVFSIYILQRIPMIAFNHVGLNKINNHLFFISCFIITLIIAWIFDFAMKKIDKVLLKRLT